MKILKVSSVAILAGLLVIASALAFIMAIIWGVQLGAKYFVVAFGAFPLALLARWLFAISDKLNDRE